MTEAKQTSVASTTTALTTQKVKLAKNFASSGSTDEEAKDFGYDSLDSAATKKEFDTLDAELNNRKDAIAKATITLEEATPYLARMQALLSQRGVDRKKILRDAKVPCWTEWAKAYAQALNYSVRTLQTRIKGLREGEKADGSEPEPSAHYTKAQTHEMVSTCNLAIEAKKAIAAGRPVDAILANVRMDDNRLLDINEVAEQLPDYRKCTERLLSVVEKFAKGEVPAGRIVEVAKEVRKEVTRKQAEASLTEAAKAGKKRKAPPPAPVAYAGTKQAEGAPPATTPTHAEANEVTAPAGTAPRLAAKPGQAAKGEPASKPCQKAGTATGRYRATSYRNGDFTDYPVLDPKGGTYCVEVTPEAAKAVQDQKNAELDRAAAGKASEHDPSRGDKRRDERSLPSSKIVHETFLGGPVVREFACVSSSAWEPPTTKYAVCIGEKSQTFLKMDEAKSACDEIADRMGRDIREAPVAPCVDQQQAVA